VPSTQVPVVAPDGISQQPPLHGSVVLQPAAEQRDPLAASAVTQAVLTGQTSQTPPLGPQLFGAVSLVAQTFGEVVVLQQLDGQLLV
jgi:hypothetical protein